MTALPTHGRFAYSSIRDRPVFDWPGGARLACYVAVNIEHFAWGQGHGAKLVPAHAEPDVLNYAWREWGNRVGVFRLLDVLGELGLPAAAPVNSAIYAHCPQVMAAVRARGDEVVSHGRTNAERQADMGEDEERAMIAQATEAIARAEGRRPAGWLGPWISESHATPDLLAEAGYSYVLDWCMDDQPVWLATRGGGRILAVPYPQEINDIPAVIGRQMNGEAFAAKIVDAFEEMLEQSTKTPLVFGIALHPYIIGQPHRLRHLRRALQAIAGRAGAWWTTPGAIAKAFVDPCADGDRVDEARR